MLRTVTWLFYVADGWTALTVILARYREWPRRGNGPVRVRNGVAAFGCAARCLGVRAAAAAAVRCRGKASGCRVVRRVPRGRDAPASAVHQLSPLSRAR
jgi:hypothetical protein